MTLSNRDLLHAALMGSDNRAIPALGRAVKLSPAQLAAAMTAKAARARAQEHPLPRADGPVDRERVDPARDHRPAAGRDENPMLGPITERVQYDAHPVGSPPITYNNTYRPAIRGT